DPLNVSVLDDLRFMLNCDVQGAVSNEEAVTRAINHYYAGQTATVEDLLAKLGEDAAGDAEVMKEGAKKMVDLSSVAEAANAAPVVKLLNLILLQAIKDQASDIHFEPFETEFKVRY